MTDIGQAENVESCQHDGGIISTSGWNHFNMTVESRQNYWGIVWTLPSTWRCVNIPLLVELYWRSLMTLIYCEWQLIPNWPLRSIFAWFIEPLLKDLVSWGSPGECSMIDHFLRDASGVLSCPFWSTVLQCGARLPIHTLNYWTVQSVVPGS